MTWWQWLVSPLAALFRGLVGLKNIAYDRHWLKVSRLQKPVISIGNLSMGGAGKTPVAMAVVQLLMDAGLRPALLSRGYGRLNMRESLKVEPEMDWRQCGDEPLMMARRYPGVGVFVGPSRASAARLARPDDYDVFVLDDGFQHRQLARDLNVVLIDVSQGIPRSFPMAPFRENINSLKRAQLVLLTRATEPTRVAELERLIRRKHAQLELEPLEFETGPPCGLDGAPLDPTLWRHQPVAAYAGIAFPEKFFEALAAQGIRVEQRRSLPDHGAFDPRALNAWIRQLKTQGINLVLTTEKDAVKLELPLESDIFVGFLPLRVKWGSQSKVRDVLLRTVRGPNFYDQAST